MGIFDWIPTAGEIFNGVSCLAIDHDWTQWFKKGEKLIRVCENCGKIETKKI